MFDVNEYFEGKVKSIALEDSQGKATIGAMAPGDYEFGTDTKEIMTVVSGALTIKLPGTDAWKTFVAGESFEVEKGLRFGVKVEEASSYLCRYF